MNHLHLPGPRCSATHVLLLYQPRPHTHMITNYTRVPSARMYSVAMRALIPLLLVSVVEALEFPYGWELWTTQDDYDVLKFPQGSGSDKGFANFSFSGRVKSTGRDYTIYIGTLSKGLPETLGFELPAGGIFRMHRLGSQKTG